MGLLSGLTKAAGSLLGGDTIKDVGNIIDNLHTSGEEKAEARQKITQILATAEQAAQAQVSARWEADMKHGSWLSKNIRPLTLVFLTAIFTVLSIFDGNLTIGDKAFTIGAAYVPVYQTLLMTVYAAYFASKVSSVNGHQ